MYLVTIDWRGGGGGPAVSVHWPAGQGLRAHDLMAPRWRRPMGIASWFTLLRLACVLLNLLHARIPDEGRQASQIEPAQSQNAYLANK